VAQLACAHTQFLESALFPRRAGETGVCGQALRTRGSAFERVTDGSLYELLQAVLRAFLAWRARSRPTGFLATDEALCPDPMYLAAHTAVNGTSAGGFHGESNTATLGGLISSELPRDLLAQGVAEYVRDNEFLCYMRVECHTAVLESAGLFLSHTPAALLQAQLPRLRMLSFAALLFTRGMLLGQTDPRALGAALQGVVPSDPRGLCDALYLLKACCSVLLELEPEAPMTEYVCNESFRLAELTTGNICLPFVEAIDTRGCSDLFAGMPLDLAGLPPPFVCFRRAKCWPGANARDAADAGEKLDHLICRYYVSSFVMRLWLSREAVRPSWWDSGPEAGGEVPPTDLLPEQPITHSDGVWTGLPPPESSCGERVASPPERVAWRVLENYRSLQASYPLVELFAQGVQRRGSGSPLRAWGGIPPR